MPELLHASLDRLDVTSPTSSRLIENFYPNAQLLGKGGAGFVYSHKSLPGDAIKIYKTTEQAEAHEAKVMAMLDRPPRSTRTNNGTVQIAWPNATVKHRGRFVGFTMPQIEFKQAWTLQQITKPFQRARHNIPERLQLRLYAAFNLASVLESLHALGHYVIDLKPQNVLVYRDDIQHSAAHIALVDCDGFQVRSTNGRRYDAELATPEFLHPDVATLVAGEASFSQKRINDNARLQDDFALTIIIFQLLNNGMHPMMGIETGTRELPSDIATRLQARGEFYAYSKANPNRAILPHPDSLHRWFDASLRQLFDRTFEGSAEPPSAREWSEALLPLTGPEYRCRHDPNHWKLRRVCGQCKMAKKMSPRAAAALAGRARGWLVSTRRAALAAVALILFTLVGTTVGDVDLKAAHPSWQSIPAEAQAFRDGVAAKLEWTRLLDHLPSDDYNKGIQFLASRANQHVQVSCVAGRTASVRFRKGCADAKSFLDQVDKRRLTEPDYRRGWNSSEGAPAQQFSERHG